MTKLATTEDVRQAIRFSSIDEINLSINSALEVATSTLETDIRTQSFDRTTRYDIFLVKHRQITKDLFEYHWRLSHGFVDSSESFSIRVADQVADFAGSNFTDITSECVIDYTKGVASVVAGELSTIRVASNSSKIIGNFVRIDYTSGFNEGDTAGFYDEAEVPTWLKEAAVLKAVNIIDTIDPSLRAPGEGSMSADSTEMLYRSMIQKNIRYFPKYDLPALKS